VPSFGEWGFVIASRRPLDVAAVQARADWPAGLRFLTPQGLPALFDFPPDMARLAVEPNRLSTQSLVHTFEAEWGQVRD
jgi:spermidine synthase